MAFYEIDEARLVVPEGWEDRSANRLEYPSKEGGVVRVIVTRTPHRKRALGAIVDAHLEDMRRRLAGFEQVERSDLLVDGEAAVELHLRFKDGPSAMVQRAIMLLVGTKVVTISVVQGAPSADELSVRADEATAAWAEVKSSLRRRKPGQDALEAAPPLPPVVVDGS